MLLTRRGLKRGLRSTGAFAAEQADDLEESYIDVDEPQAGDQAFEGWLIPHRFDVGTKSLEVIQRPGILPGENDQEEADFEGEDGETNSQQTALPALRGDCQSSLDRRRIFGKRAAWGW